ncbi:MAG: thermonuclease family protein [Alphaproteobacteria bacterium]|nr:thermonuclease family protein [Alphaproteobacteria bacterium]MDE1987061.1 thermonuclease family protein [Alphaproteobacteria bacterium]MDE2163894.1 thermonuclease family protein [Alphaproteobacteria bacterium]MDE2266576.1 thermonuclease family protein [Alphaproteobacteria bacterium]
MAGRVLFSVILAVVSACCAAQAEAPACAGGVEIGDAHIVRVEHNDVLVLDDGRALLLAGIVLPNAAQDHAPQMFTDQAYHALNALAADETLVARAIYPKEDRYDRIRSQVFTRDGTWLQLALLKRGLARVDLTPDRGECANELYTAEAQARAAHLGIWSAPAYAIRTPDALKGDVGTFQIVQGKVLNADVRDGRAYLNFGADWKTDFTVTISPDDMKLYRQMGVDPRGYQGKVMRVRGIVQWLNGPEIELANPKQAEVLQ